MASLKEAVDHYQVLNRSFNKKNPDLNKCHQELKTLKVS